MSKTRLFVMGLALASVTSFSATAKAPVRPAPLATVVSETLVPETTGTSLSLVGHLTAPRSVLLTSKVTATLSEVTLKDNHVVEQGDVVMQFDDRHAQAQYAEALALYQDAERQLADRQRLLKRGAVTEGEVEIQKTQVATLKARLSAAKATLADHQIRAPFDGTVGLVDLVAGQSVKAGDGLITLKNQETLRLDLSVPEQYWSQLTVGMPVTATTKAWGNTQFHGKISALNSAVDPQSLSLTVRVVFDNAEGKLAAGMLMSADLTLPTVTQPTVSMASIKYDGQQRFVYRIDSASIAHQTPIQTGATVGNRFVVTDGVAFGDRVVVKGLVKLKDGTKVVDMTEQGV